MIQAALHGLRGTALCSSAILVNLSGQNRTRRRAPGHHRRNEGLLFIIDALSARIAEKKPARAIVLMCS
jgi:hypothetical protein